METLIKQNEFLKTTYESEGTAGNLRIRMKTTDPETKKVYADYKLMPMEFLQQYGQFLGGKEQLTTGLKQLEDQINAKVWEKWPEQVKTMKKDLEQLEKDKKELYLNIFQDVKKVIPKEQIAQIMGRFRVTNYE